MSEYGSEGFQVRLRRLSKYGSVAYLVERPTRETRAEQYSDTAPREDSITSEAFLCIAQHFCEDEIPTNLSVLKTSSGLEILDILGILEILTYSERPL